MMIIRKFLVPLLLTAVLGQTSTAANGEHIKQYAREIRHPLVVVALALKPGDEDFLLLEELRFKRGALVTTVYATNGEWQESDLGSMYPHDLAATLREEATQAMNILKCDVRFLNLHSPGSVRDSAGLAAVWDADSVQIRLMKAITETRPHLVILFPEQGLTKPSFVWQSLRSHLRKAVQRLQQPANVSELKRLANLPAWDVQRVVVGRTAKTPRPVRSARVREAEESYKSLAVQQKFWAIHEYDDVVFPGKPRKTKTAYEGLPSSIPDNLRSLDRKIGQFARRLLNVQTFGSAQQRTTLKSLLPLADSVDALISGKYYTMSRREQKLVLVWKDLLQSIKNELLGVSVSYTLEDSALTAIQVTKLFINTVDGASPDSKLWFLFPPASKGWIINETMDQRHALRPGDEFRIVTPQNVPFNLPPQFEGLQQEEIITPIDCFVVQSGNDRSKNFAVRLRLPFRFAPRFTAEVLTPIVRAIDGERVAVRLTNYSRDGVSDEIGISDSLVSSPRRPFRLPGKETTHTDTLVLTWHQPIEGSAVIPIDIDGIVVANVAARAFDVGIDSSATVGLISHEGISAAAETLRRLGMKWNRSRPAEVTAEWLAKHSVILLDHRVYSLEPGISHLNGILAEYARNGGRIVVLSQDPESWNADPLVQGLTLERDADLAPEGDVELADHPVLQMPNVLMPEDWASWLFARAKNRVNVVSDAVIPVKDAVSGTPLIAIVPNGRGEVVYVNLNLPTQWLNIHAGSFRLLANLLVY